MDSRRLGLACRQPVRRALSRWRRAAAGNVAVEFGFIIPILVMLALGTFDFGRLGLEKIAVTSAARAGAQYGMQDFVTAADSPGMIQAALNDAGVTLNEMNVTPRPAYCYCASDGEVACTAPCSDSSYPMMYVEVTASEDVHLLFSYPGLNQTQTVTSTSRMRVR